MSDAVAASLGHGSFAITARHYAAPTSVHNAKTARVERLLAGRPEIFDAKEADEAVHEEDVFKRMQKLDRATLLQLLEQAEAASSRKPN